MTRLPQAPCRRAALALSLGLAAGSALAQASTTTAPDERGFSYFMGLGAQSATYQETPSTVPAKSKARVTNPLLITGALYAINADTLMTLDSETTFASGTSTERWTATASSVGGVTITDPLLQTNRFNLQESTTRLLLQYRVNGPLFVVAGPGFHSQSFKRFGFRIGVDNAVNLPADRTIEESASEVLVQAGLALESEHVRNSRDHYSLRVTAGVPIWRRVESTAYPDASFTGTRGYDVSLSGRYSYAVVPHVHIGLWGQLQHSQRNAQVQGGLELPKSTLGSVAGGLELLWKL
jgi:hypothetical protein